LFIATLIAAGRLTETTISEAAKCLDEAGCGPERFEWIDRGDAATIPFQWQFAGAKAVLEGVFDRVDVIVQPAWKRQKKLLVADMDSTMIGQECIDELADYARCKPEVAEITERAMRGELNFADALKERVALLKGLDVAILEQCLSERIHPNPGAATLVRTMRAKGAQTILVSGGFTAFVEPIAREIGFDRFEANILDSVDGRLTGTTRGRVVDSWIKQAVLADTRDRLGLARDDTLAIGDGANDILMVEEAGLGIAYHSKPALAQVADGRIDHHGLDAILWAQGIARSEWVEG